MSDAVRYAFTASMGVLDIAADFKEKWLFDIYRIGREATEAGSHSSGSYIM